MPNSIATLTSRAFAAGAAVHEAGSETAYGCGCPACQGLSASGPEASIPDAAGGGTADNGKPVWTLEQVIGPSGLLRWQEAWPQEAVITYSFLTALPPGTDTADYGFVAFTETEKAFTRAAFDLISDIVPLTFVEAPWDGRSFYASERIVFGGNSKADDFEWGHAIRGTYPRVGMDEISNAEVWISPEAVNVRQWIYGGYNFKSLIHEILHALGLPHPGNYNADGEPITYAQDANYFQDSSQFTVMSYFDEEETGASFLLGTDPGLPGAEPGLYSPSTPQLHDIAALQALYEANMATRAGDTVYGYNSTTGRPSYDVTQASAPVFTIWDGGGTDTLDLSGSRLAANVDLNEGGFTNAFGMIGNIAIAYGAKIENARGGSAADTLLGNALANRLEGGGGSDTLDGAGGDDIAVFSGDLSGYAIASSGGGRTVTDLRPGGGDGTDTLTSIEALAFADQTIIVGEVADATRAAVAVTNILRLDPATAAYQSLVASLTADLQAGDSIAEVIDRVVTQADATTSVATLAYQFFVGFAPSGGGLNFLVSPTGPNANNINSAYYQFFNLENRYINFAVNLGVVGEGHASFLAEYGVKSLTEATRSAYAEIFGVTPDDAKLALLLDADIGAGMTRRDYFAFYGRDGLEGLGTKAAMVGWLLAEAEKIDDGTYALSNHAYLTDLADGAAFLVDLVGVYGQPDFALS
ncbi:MAG: M10 family metallopeptidase [Caulobacteraceae bacterium]|nr:M10 family metallopeptidase [Caulobacteraceae bacterium]